MAGGCRCRCNCSFARRRRVFYCTWLKGGFSCSLSIIFCWTLTGTPICPRGILGQRVHEIDLGRHVVAICKRCRVQLTGYNTAPTSFPLGSTSGLKRWILNFLLELGLGEVCLNKGPDGDLRGSLGGTGRGSWANNTWHDRRPWAARGPQSQ